ncbi:hypothetical protein PVAG01_01308 [Phlyctema vagabunda]|uniref:Uncharacterized protein n=1 Tax=Phlyctema vagabunda TaxID=108571 RepID=A0ABR4PWR9_9HELO
MKLSITTFGAILALSSQVICAPKAIPVPAPAAVSTGSVVNNINGIYQVGIDAINTDLNAITQAVNTYANSVGGQLTLVVALKADLDAIIKQTNSTISQIFQSTQVAVGALTADEVQALIATLNAVGNFVLAAERVIDATSRALQDSTRALVAQELAAAAAVLPALLNPFRAFVQGTALQGAFSGTALLGALSAALTTILGVVNGLLGGLGITSGS